MNVIVVNALHISLGKNGILNLVQEKEKVVFTRALLSAKIIELVWQERGWTTFRDST